MGTGSTADDGLVDEAIFVEAAARATGESNSASVTAGDTPGRKHVQAVKNFIDVAFS